MTGNLLEGKSCDCEVVNNLDWIVNNSTIIRPDTMVVYGKIQTDYLTFPPALILEIASPATYLKDRNIKFKLYELNSMRYYLLADTENKKVECFELMENQHQSKFDTHFQLTEIVQSA